MQLYGIWFAKAHFTFFTKNNSNGNSNFFTGIHPSKCDPHFKQIVKCMADGRNHVPCCERNQVPDICQDMCIGDYTLQSDDVRTHLSCGAYTAPTLACIAEGIGKYRF